jgi:hypothetical protein
MDSREQTLTKSDINMVRCTQNNVTFNNTTRGGLNMKTMKLSHPGGTLYTSHAPKNTNSISATRTEWSQVAPGVIH